MRTAAGLRSVETRSGSVIQNPPKSRRGTRLVSIDPVTRAVLRAHEERQRAELSALGMTADQRPERVFTSEVGRTLNASNLGKIWHRLQDDAGVRPARFHDLRHMHLSRLVMRGMDIKTVADRAGHADPILTMRQYIHAFDAQRKKAAIPLDQLLDEETSG